jgi:hypothetical protein
MGKTTVTVMFAVLFARPICRNDKVDRLTDPTA